jgi:iron complex outermembrane recepter protein
MTAATWRTAARRAAGWLAAGSVAACLGAAASAQTNEPAATGDASLTHLSLEELSAIVVTSVTKEPEEVWRTPAAIYVLTRDDIRRSGVISIADALRLVPGVEVAQIDASRNWVVGIRGFGDQFSKSVLVLIDGRSVYTPLFAGVEWSTQETLLEDVDRIEVIRGPGGTVWGSNAVNGVINIITQSAAATHGVYARAGGGSVEHAVGSVRAGGAASTVDYRAYGEGFLFGPQFHTEDTDYDRRHTGQGGFRLDWRRSDRDTVTVHGDAYKGVLGESVRVATFAPPGTSLLRGPEDVDGENIVAKWQRDLGNGSDFFVQTYFDRTYRLGLDFGETRDTFDVDFIRHRPIGARHDLIWGAGLRLSPSTFIQTVSASDFQPHDLTSTIYSGFVQDTIDVTHTISLVAGVKVERTNYTNGEVQPSVRLLWARGDQTAWGAITRAVRTPSRIDEDIRVAIFAAAAPPLYAILAGNPAIAPEQVVSMEAGYRALVGPRVYVDVSAFHNQYDNLVDLGAAMSSSQETDGLRYTAITFPWANGIRGTTNGIEIAPSADLGSAWRLKGSYSYLHLDLENKAGNTDVNTLAMLQNDSPHHTAIVDSQVDLPHGWRVDGVYRFVSARTFGGVPAYQTADLRAAWRIGQRIELSVDGRNLLQPHHAEWARDPGPTVDILRSIYGQVAWGR